MLILAVREWRWRCSGFILRRRAGSFARSLTAREASNYFRHAGYA
jgi:hypothetical protein